LIEAIGQGSKQYGENSIARLIHTASVQPQTTESRKNRLILTVGYRCGMMFTTSILKLPSADKLRFCDQSTPDGNIIGAVYSHSHN
jgi:hypothetical protein